MMKALQLILQMFQNPNQEVKTQFILSCLELISINAEVSSTPGTESLYIETEYGGNILDIPYVLATPSAYQVLHFVSEESVDITIQDPTDETIVAFAFNGTTTLNIGSDLAREYNTEFLFNFPACSDPNSIPENLGTVYYLTQPINDCFLLILGESERFLLIPSSTGDITTDPQFEVRSLNLEA